ncbi:MAG: outer membrane lipoprotein carrier protein LolA [Candidatus Aminicenantales bacterium]
MLLLAAFSCAALPAQEPPQALLLRMEKSLAVTDAFQADFEQSSYSQAVSKPLLQKGRLTFRKPDLMRWEYGPPEKNIYVFKDGLLLSYFPEDNQLWRQRIPKEKYETEILALLAGRGSLTQKYAVEDSPFPGGGPGIAQLKLTPKEESDYAYLLLELDGAGASIRKIIFFSWGGDRQEFDFSRFKTGIKPSDDLFQIKVPKDCEIIDETAPIRK